MSKLIPSGGFAARMKNNQRGFMLLSVIFLTLVVSTGAMILLHANAKVQQRNSTLYLTAINLANEQFAELESRAAAGSLHGGSYNFLGDIDNLKSYNGLDLKKIADGSATPVEFDVETTVADYPIENLREITVTVKWAAGGKENFITSKKILRIQ